MNNEERPAWAIEADAEWNAKVAKIEAAWEPNPVGYRVQHANYAGRKPWQVVYFFEDGRAKIVSDHTSERAAIRAMNAR